MLLFLKKIIVFLIPVGVIFAFPVYIIITAREYVSINDVVTVQTLIPASIFGFGYGDISQIPYKEKLVAVKNPTIITLGTSKVMQIRKEFFIQPEKFVNAGGAGRTFGDIEIFIHDLPQESKIKIIILGIDQEMFYRSYDSGTVRKDIDGPTRFIKILSTMSRRVYLDYFSHKYVLSDLINNAKINSNIGLPAILYDSGFREDGSYKYGQAEHNPGRKEKVSKEIDAVAAQTKIAKLYESEGEENSQLEINIQALKRILDECKKRNITVIGVMSPYPTPIYEAMKQSKGLAYKESVVLPDKVRAIFASYTNPFFDLSSLATFSGKEGEFVDSVHITDVSQLRTIIYIAEHTRTLDSFVDVIKLKEILQNSTGDFLEF